MDDQDIKQKYLAQRDEFNKKKESLLEQISEHQSAITQLQGQIDRERPKTEHGQMTCDTCDCVSMKYVGRTPRGGASGGDNIYECEICGREEIEYF